MDTKIIAYYLPQYHEIQENNEWWGSGFTEWTHVKGAKSLYKGHYQPVRPLHDNYYDLTDRETVEWQTKLAKEHHVYGFAYYHYWFQGRKLLEKPAENLLQWKDIEQNFFFFWANHTWYQAEKGVKRILIEQEYGDQSDWIEHYNYLRQFFMDDRYIKIDNKPVMGIYMPSGIDELDAMIRCWNEKAIEDGFSGVYIIESLNSREERIHSTLTQAATIRQPNISMQECRKRRSYFHRGIRKVVTKFCLPILETNDFCKIMDLEKNVSKNAFLGGQASEDAKLFYGISNGWDNTPRHGRYGHVFMNKDASLFKDTIKELYHKAKEQQDEFLFINAWNEWAEGMYLEPDERYGHSFLEAVKEAVEEVGE